MRSVLTVWIAVISLGCSPVPRWVYQAETSVAANGASVGFSEIDLQRAETVAAEVAKRCRMRPEEISEETLELEQARSSTRKPPRRFLTHYYRKLRPFELPIELILEVSEDGRSLYFTVVDPERGSTSLEIDCVREGLKVTVEREFQGMTIVHEEKPIGPIFDLHP